MPQRLFFQNSRLSAFSAPPTFKSSWLPTCAKGGNSWKATFEARTFLPKAHGIISEALGRCMSEFCKLKYQRMGVSAPQR